MMEFMVRKIFIIFLMSLFSGGTVLASVAQSPLFLVTSVDPNVLFNMSVETSMGGAAYNDQLDGATGCGGRVLDPDPDPEEDPEEVGMCYFPGQTYLGYFDPNKCYTYSTDRFVPAGATIASHQCSGEGEYSGNFMNWATMTAMDMFVWTMTGGNRVVDTTTETVIRRTRKQNNDSLFPDKLIISASSVTPWSGPVYIHNTEFGVEFGSAYGASDLGTNNVQIKVCESSSLETNCVPYGSPTVYYKPEGLIQKNADHMRFGVTSYTKTDGNDIDGGVLRSNMKYVGTTRPDGSGGTEDNPNKEIKADGTIETNSNPADATASSVSLSGVISYLNKFSDVGYKANDPASELFYESIRYFKNLGPTAEYLTGDNGDFPILGAGSWEDPIQYGCQNNFIIGINDANPWKDKRLPGTFFTSNSINNVVDISDDYGEPSTPDTDINVKALTNTVGTLEGLTGTSQCIGCTASNCDMLATNKTIHGLGEVMGTCPTPAKENSYYIAGLAYYANTQDIRTGAGGTTNFPGKQTISSFLIDTQEYSSSPLVGQMNMLWLAGKYGGFVDDNGDSDPNNGAVTTEWDADSDGEPDNYVLATQPEKLVSSLNRAFTNIEALTSSAAAVATNTTRLDTNTKIYQARFNSATWEGQLLAFNLNADGSIGTLAWDAATLIPTEASRHIFSYDPTAGSGIEFEYANMNTAQKALMDTDPSGTTDTFGASRADHIRGDTSTEVQNGGDFRDRTSLMGDIINSDPWFLGNLEDFGYTKLEGTEGTSYVTFRTAKLSRTPTVFFSANDAMLHAINASTGAELFTYVPDAVIASLSTLASPWYGCDGAGCIPHQYFVDGAPRAADAYYGAAWHSVLVGTLGAGGKALFALDVTDPATFSQSNVLWEISTAQSPNDSDLSEFSSNLGYTLPQASIVRLRDGTDGVWAAVVGNGYESAGHKAVLYIIDIQTGHIIRSIDTGAGDVSSPNGLSTPITVDEDGDRIVDSIYAGDLLGNLWKFDVTADNTTSWEIAYGTGPSPLPLYHAVDGLGANQPITAKPQVGKHPDGGLMVYFGTGKYYADNDQLVGDTPQVQSFYAIRDQGSTVGDRDDLLEQEILAEATLTFTDFSIDVRVTSDTVVDYSTDDGWFMDLVSPVNGPEGERVVSAPLLRSGRIIFTTLIPDPDPCDWGGSSWLMELDSINGSRLATSPFDVNGDGHIDESDYVAIYDTDEDGVVDSDDANTPTSGIRTPGLGIIKTPGVVIGDDGKEYKYTSGSSGNLNVLTESSGSPTGRQSWRQLR